MWLQMDRDSVQWQAQAVTGAETRSEVESLNAFLSSVYGEEMRMSTLLARSGLTGEQIQRLRDHHLHQLITYLHEVIRARMLRWQRGNELYAIICRRFGFVGGRSETLQEIGQSLNLSRERIRQLEKKTLRRCKIMTRPMHLQEPLRAFALSLRVEAGNEDIRDQSGACMLAPITPQNGMQSDAQLPDPVPFSGESPDLEAAEDKQGTAQTVHVDALLERVLGATGPDLSISIIAPILTGNHGPVVNAVVGHYGLEDVHGALQPRSYDDVKALVQLARKRRKETPIPSRDTEPAPKDDLLEPRCIRELTDSVCRAIG